MKFPIDIVGRVLVLTPQLRVLDADGTLRLYVKQKMFRLREKVEVYLDEDRKQLAYTMKADRILDFSVNYTVTNNQDQIIGAIGRKGLRSLWRAHYEITRNGQSVATVREENAWIKVLDGLLDSIPVVGAAAGFFLHPKYIVTNPAGQEIIRLSKRASFIERRYTIDQLSPVGTDEELIVVSLMMLVLLDGQRG